MGKIQRKKYRVHLPPVPLTKSEESSNVFNISNNKETEVLEKNSVSTGLSRGQRKRLKRQMGIEKKLGMIQKTLAQKESSITSKFSDLEELRSSLVLSMSEETSKSNAKTKKYSSKMTQKQKKHMALEELGQFKAVQKHPSFQSNPFLAIQTHLKNTLK